MPDAAFPQMTPKAAAAFAAYVAMGEGRSLEKLAQQRVREKFYKNTASALRQLSKWSSAFRWQDRLGTATTKAADDALAEAAELDALTFLATSRLLHERVGYSTHHNLDAIVKMRESVRKPQPRGGVNVNVTVEIQKLAERLAADLGIPATDLLQDAMSIAERTRGEFQA